MAQLQTSHCMPYECIARGPSGPAEINIISYTIINNNHTIIIIIMIIITIIIIIGICPWAPGTC